MRGRLGVLVVLTAVLMAAACSDQPAESASGGNRVPEAETAVTVADSTSPGDTASSLLAPARSQSASNTEPEPVKIGVIMATGGRLAGHDGPVLDALGYAVQQVNASGGLLGRPLELLFEDSDSELNTAYEAARQLLEQGVSVLFTSCDPYFNRPVREAAHEAAVLVIVPCGPEPPPTEAAGQALVFSAGTPAAAYGRALADYAFDAGIASVAALIERDRAEASQMCDSFYQRFAELGGSVGFSLAFDRQWIADQAVLGARATAAALAPASRFPAVVICAAIAGRGIQMFELLRSAGVESQVLAPAALDGVAWQRGVFGVEPLVVITEASTFGDDPSAQVNAYFASIITGDLRRERESSGQVNGPGGLAEVEDRVGWGVTGAEALWIFIRSVLRTESLAPEVLAADIEQFQEVELWNDSASFDPSRHIVGGRTLRVIRHDGGASRLVELRNPTEP